MFSSGRKELKEIKDLLAQIELAKAQKKHFQVSEYAKKINKIDKNHIEAYIIRAEALEALSKKALRLGKWEGVSNKRIEASECYSEAKKRLKKKLRLNREDPSAEPIRASIRNLSKKQIKNLLKLIKSEKAEPKLVAQYAKEIIEIDENHIEAHMLRAKALKALGKYQRAQIVLKAVLGLNSEYLPAYILRASIFYLSKKYADAINNATKAIELNPSHAKAYLVRARAKESISDYQGALEDVGQAMNLHSLMEEGFKISASCRYKLKDYAGAIEDVNRVIALDPSEFDKYPLLTLRAKALFKKGDYAHAIEDANAAIDLESALYRLREKAKSDRKDYRGPEILYKLRAHAKYATGDYEGAEADLNEFTRLNTIERKESYILGAKISFQCGDYAQTVTKAPVAIEAWEEKSAEMYSLYAEAGLATQMPLVDILKLTTQATELDPTYGLAYQVRAQAHLQEGNASPALKAATKAIKLGCRNQRVFEIRADCYDEMKQHQKAIQDASNVIALNPENGWGYALRAWAKYHEAKLKNTGYQTALEDVNKALEFLHVTDTRGIHSYRARGNPYKLRALIHFNSGNYSLVEADAREAIKLNTKNNYDTIDIYALIIEAKLKEQDYEGAIQEIKQALALFPKEIVFFQLGAQAYRAIKKVGPALVFEWKIYTHNKKHDPLTLAEHAKYTILEKHGTVMATVSQFSDDISALKCILADHDITTDTIAHVRASQGLATDTQDLYGALHNEEQVRLTLAALREQNRSALQRNSITQSLGTLFSSPLQTTEEPEEVVPATKRLGA